MVNYVGCIFYHDNKKKGIEVGCILILANPSQFRECQSKDPQRGLTLRKVFYSLFLIYFSPKPNHESIVSIAEKGKLGAPKHSYPKPQD